MTTLNAADAVAIHKALHTKPIPAVVSTTIGTLSVLPNKYGNGSVRLWPFGPDGQLGPTMVGANPNKESSYARKMRAGGAVTLINPLGSLGYEARCIVLESLTPSSEPTVASGLHFGIKGLLQGLGADLNHAVEDAAVSPVNLNVGDKKRMRDDGELKQIEAQAGHKPKKAAKKSEVNLVGVAANNRAKCKHCKLVTAKDKLRFGFTSNYMGHLSNNWLHPQCVVAFGRNLPTAVALESMDGFNELGESARAEAHDHVAAVHGQAEVPRVAMALTQVEETHVPQVEEPHDVPHVPTYAGLVD